MKIKDIRYYRKFYKECARQIKDEKMNENFVGHSFNINNDKIVGYFELYHGDKPDIKKYIMQSIEIAQDWQSIYELLQNAFDSKSSVFGLFFSEKHLLAFNNGEQFTFEGVRSVLNIGQSTKDFKSNIGKYGIGFKIIHKLIGKSNGINELLNYDGPILFSWNNISSLEEFTEVNSINDIENIIPKFTAKGDKFFCNDSLPWLFKILLTCFPCGLNDEVYDLSYNIRNDLFSIQDLMIMKNIVKQNILYSNLFSNSELNRGTLVYLNLGEKKYDRLKENHLTSGITYSLSVLNSVSGIENSSKIHKVYINEQLITPSEIIIDLFRFNKNNTYYNRIYDNYSENPEIIEFLFGYSSNYNSRQIIGNPNFYVYFPLSDEVHNLNFIIHCNAFHNLSQRNNLDDGQRNKDVLKLIADLIIQEMENVKNTNFEKYLCIFAAILTSDWKAVTKKTWVFESLVEPLIKYTENNVPTISESIAIKERVKIKSTSLNIKPSDFGIKDFNWFYWTDNIDLINEAINSNKLGLFEKSLQDLIASASHYNMINKWIENNKDNIEVFLNEINYTPITRYEVNEFTKISHLTSLAYNLSYLKIFNFSDSKNYSIRDVEYNRNLLFLSNEYYTLIEPLNNLGFILISIDEIKYNNLFEFLSDEFTYFKEKVKLIDYIADRIKTFKINSLSKSDIKSIIIYFNNYYCPIFEKIIIEEVKETYKILPKSNKYQYYTNSLNVNLIEYISEYFSDKYYLLHNELYNITKNKTGIIDDSKLYEYLLNENSQYHKLIDVILESKNTDIQIKYLNCINELLIEEGKEYDGKSFEHKILDLVKNLSVENFWKKIKIKTKEGLIISLEEIQYSNKVIFKDESDKLISYKLKLSQILHKYEKSSQLIDNIIKSFPGFNEYNLKTYVFKISKQKPKDDIFHELDSNILNAHQLAFLLLYIHINNNKISWQQYRIKLKSDIMVSLSNGTYYINNLSFISDNKILNRSYEEIIDLLKLNSQKPYFEVQDVKIIISPYIYKDTFNCLSLKSSIKDNLELQKNLFLFLFSAYSKKSITDKILEFNISVEKDKNIFERNVDSKEKDLILGFDPEKTVFPDKYCLEKEKLPRWIINDWLFKENYDIKIMFLKSLGVNTEDSKLVYLRKYLSNEISVPLQINELTILREKGYGYLHRSLHWILNNFKNKINVVINTEMYDFFTEIYRSNLDLKSYPFLKIVKLNTDGNLVFTLTEYNDKYKYYFITSELKEVMIKLEQPVQSLDNLINSDDRSVFLYNGLYDDTLLKGINSQDLHLYEILDDEFLAHFKEVNSHSYLNWKVEMHNIFKIFINENETSLKYNIIANGVVISKIKKNEIDISKDGIIYVAGKMDDLLNLLERIIGRNNFRKEDLNLLLEKNKLEPNEVDKVFSSEFEPFRPEIIEITEKENDIYFPKGEIKSFKNKLLELLGYSNSIWAGYIYHFTHIENAVNIIKQRKILPRKKAKFKNSAGKSFIETTSSEIKNFARFYFRPLTPTQYYNEGLGKKTPKGDLPQCPVPVFFRFSIEEVLKKYETKCFVSNGNLRHYPHTNYGNTYNFLKKFNFKYLYYLYGECDKYTFLNASQQEFIIRDELDFSDLSSLQIICRDSMEKDTLIKLLGNERQYIEKISTNSHYYHNRNPNTNLNVSNNKIIIHLPYTAVKSMIQLEIYNSDEKRSIELIRSDKNIEYESLDGNIYCKIYYVNLLENIEWLIYSNVN